jgi:hypothetical protein
MLKGVSQKFYEIVGARLGSGSYGEVYVCQLYQQEHGGLFAVKIIQNMSDE